MNTKTIERVLTSNKRPGHNKELFRKLPFLCILPPLTQKENTGRLRTGQKDDNRKIHGGSTALRPEKSACADVS